MSLNTTSRLRLAAIMGLLALAGCGGGSGTETAPAPPPVASPPPAPAPAPPAAVSPTISSQPAAATLAAGASASFSVLASGTATLGYQWQRDGLNIPGATSATYTLPAVGPADSGASFRVVVSNSAGSVTSAAAVLNVLAAVAAPTITVAPQSANALDGGSATLSVVAGGTAPFTYVWRRNGAVIDSATASSYTTPALTLADSGTRYSVVVTNSAGNVTSADAAITVNPVAPTIATAPVSLAVTTGQTASFSANADGSAPLAYQWLRNGVVIAGATGASYTTPATTLADNGARFRVSVSNAGGNVSSAEASLSVSAAIVSPAIATAPLGAMVQEGQTASFTVAATGTAPLAYQWLRNGVAIAGATAASYTTGATTVAGDNGARFSVRVTNAGGAASSAEALLSVQAATSPLIGRAWASANLLETNDNPVFLTRAAISDEGIATVVFTKSDGTRRVLYATRGTPGAAGQTPQWAPPEAIDRLNGVDLTTPSNSPVVSIASSAIGNAVAVWEVPGPCNSTTYDTNDSSCSNWYAARYLVASGRWDAPALIGVLPDVLPTLPFINDRGDVAVRMTGWVRSGTTSYRSRVGVARRSVSDTGFSFTTFDDASLAESALGLDEGGNLLLAAEATQEATTDIVTYRGTVGGGFAARVVLDQRGNAASMKHLAVGRNGQQAVAWLQNNGVTSRTFVAVSASPTGAWQVTDLAANISGFNTAMTVADAGVVNLHDIFSRDLWRWANGAWSEQITVPASQPFGSSYSCNVARSGDFLCTNNSNSGGTWTTYDVARNLIVQPIVNTSPGSGFILGVNVINRGVGFSDPLLSVSGVGFMSLFNDFDVLPSAAAPAGDRRNVDNLWGVFLK